MDLTLSLQRLVPRPVAPEIDFLDPLHPEPADTSAPDTSPKSFQGPK